MSEGQQGPIPQDYTHEDGYNEDTGFEMCPHCEKQLGGESGHHGAVYSTSGTKHDHLLNTDPGDGPFICPDCWPQLEANQKASENKSLGEFA